jgi:CheY-like chemotaxis protein
MVSIHNPFQRFVLVFIRRSNMWCSSNTLFPQFANLYATCPQPVDRTPTVVVVEDDEYLSQSIQTMCEFLNVAVARVSSSNDLTPILQDHRPMAVLAELDSKGQDGCHVMKTVARYDASLPILLLTGHDPHLAGAAEAVEELWGLSSVVKRPFLPRAGEFVEFLCRAGQMGRCLGLMPA